MHARAGGGASVAAIAGLAPVAMLLLTIALVSPVRATAFTMLFTAVLLVFLEIDRHGAAWWIAPWLVLHVVWVNLHGGFIVGLAVVGAAGMDRVAAALVRGERWCSAARRVRQLAIVAAAMALLALVNPYGWEYVPYLVRAARLHRPAIAEWAPLWDPRVSRMLLSAYAVSVAILAAAVIRAGWRTALGVSGAAFVVISAGTALLSARHLPIYAVAWLCYVAPVVTLGRASRPIPGSAARLAAIASAGAAVAGIWMTAASSAWRLTIPREPDADGRWYPVGAVEFLSASRFAGRLLTRFADGSYVSWELYPAVRVSFDTRYEAAYVPGTYEEHEALFAAGRGWDAALARYAPDAILAPMSSPLRAALDGRAAEWRCIYRDAVDAIYLRAPVASGG